MHRNFLWKQPTVGSEPIVLGLTNRKKPDVKIRQRILNLAYQTYLESKESLFVIGSLEIGPKSEGLSVEINAVRGKPQPGLKADFMANCRFCRLVEARDPNDTVLELVEDVKTKQYTSSTFSLKSLTDYFSIDIHGKLEGPNCTVDVSMVCFERRLKAQPIKPLQIAKNTVYKMIQQTRNDILWGWTHMSKGSFNLLCKDDLRQDCSGVWVAGCSTLNNPAIWLICQHFLNTVDRSDILALLFFDESGEPKYFNVTAHDDVMRTVVFSGIEKTTVTRVFTARDRLVEIPLTMSYVDDGEFTLDTTRNHTQVLEEISKELEQESYSLKTRTGLPQLLSPRPLHQYTPATIGVHKILPKRITLSPISPPSSSSTPNERNERKSYPPEKNSVNPEVMELIRKQEMEISFLKEQIQMLMIKQNSPPPAEPRPQQPLHPVNDHRNSGSSEQILPKPMACLLSPPREPPQLNFVPLKPYVPETIIESVQNKENDQRLDDSMPKMDNFYNDLKKGLFEALKEPAVVEDCFPTTSFALPKLGQIPKARYSDPLPLSSMIQPRLEYEPLLLSGSSQPSLLMNEVTKKYFGRSPQLPNVNKIVKKTSPQVGMLKRVLTSQATKQVLCSDDNSKAPQPRFLDVDALKNQPKLL